MSIRFLCCSILSTVACLCGCSEGGDTGQQRAEAETRTYSADLAVAWFDQVYDSIRAEGYSPPVASRVIGYCGVTLYQSVVEGMPDHRSLAGQLNGLGQMPARPKDSLYWPAVANAGLGTVTQGLFASGSAGTLAELVALEDSLKNGFSGAADAATLQRSADHGAAIGAAILTWAAGDGFAIWNNCAYTPPVSPGAWVPTPPALAAPLQPCWGNLRTFVLDYAAECVPLGYPTFSTEAGSAFHLEALEVRDTVDNLTPEQLEIARYWADAPVTTGTPPGHWISICGQLCEERDDSLDVAAEAFARVGMAVADAFISCWEIKYYFNLMRPITYIRDPGGPINDPSWTTAPGIGTPNFPEFTSGHSVQSGAAAAVLTDLLGEVAFTDETHLASGLAARSFDSLEDAAQEAAMSRLYGGIHFRSAIERGLEQGQCVARRILERVQFRK